MKKYKHKRTITYNGKRFYVYGDTLEEIGRKKAEKMQSLKQRTIKDETKTVAEWAPYCIETYKTGQSEATKKDYINRINTGIVRHIGEYELSKITPTMCQDVLNRQAGNSKTQINYIYHGLKFIFSKAYDNGLVLEDPTRNLTKPKGTDHHRRALTPEEKRIFIKIASTDRKYYCFLLMLYCGCRPKEACNCLGSDITIKDGNPVLHIRGTKTKNADRYVYIPKPLFNLIKDTKKNEYISQYKSGLPISTNNRHKLWHGLWYKMNLEAGTNSYRNHLLEPYLIPKDLKPYCLRHEYCSELARRGVDIRIAQRLMGHSTINMTANIYTHIENENIISQVAKVFD